MRKLFLTVIIILCLVIDYSYGEEIISAQIHGYINEMESLFSKYPDPWSYSEGTIQYEEYKKILNKFNLNDTEYLEVLDILTKDYDVIEMCNKMQKKEMSFDQDIWNRGLIFVSTAESLNQRWTKNVSSLENIIADKIVPIISLNNNPVIKRYWIVKSGDMLRDINNTKIPMSDEHRNNVCDAYLEIFNKEDQDNYTRIKAIESWSVAENRSDKIISNVENISKNKILFKNTAFYLYRGHRTPEEVTNKMLNILENSNKYPEEIIDGALNFLGRASTSDDTVLISRLKKVLNYKVKEDKASKKQKRYERILKSIEWHEKREIIQ